MSLLNGRNSPDAHGCACVLLAGAALTIIVIVATALCFPLALRYGIGDPNGPGDYTNRTNQQLQTAIANVQANPYDPTARNNLGRILSERYNRNLEAIKQFNRAAQLAPNSGEPHYYLGETYRTLNDSDLAIREFQIAVALDGGRTKSWRDALQFEIEQRSSRKQISPKSK